MNFIKKNIIFSIVAAITLIASAYLIYLDMVTHAAISYANEQTQDSKSKFDEAYSRGNRPVDKNIEWIQKDTAELKVLTTDLQRIFGKPYRRALLVFAKALNFTEDQLYARMKGLFNSAEKRDATAEKLIPKLFDALARDMMARDAKDGAKIEENTPVDPKYRNQVQEAYRNFVAEVQKETVEDIFTNPTREQMVSSGYHFLASALGLPREMNNSQARSYLKDLQSKFTVRRLIPGVTSEATVQNFTYNAYDKTPPPPDAVPDILNTMPIFEDIFNRMSFSRLTRIDRFFRLGLPTKVAGDHYECYSFDVTVTGSLDSVRNFVNNLLGAYKQNRVYVVTWVKLTSPASNAEVEDVRKTLMGTDTQRPEQQEEMPPPGRRPRRRRPPNQPAVRRTAMQKQISEFDAESQPDYGKTVIGATSDVSADLKFKYYKYIGDTLKK
ncbi:MAG: hypothetical protein IJS14_01850 [Lentisphaeria bacterium]|nr:hypothetical protein [Lentisphaeria bacterium]